MTLHERYIPESEFSQEAVERKHYTVTTVRSFCEAGDLNVDYQCLLPVKNHVHSELQPIYVPCSRCGRKGRARGVTVRGSRKMASACLSAGNADEVRERTGLGGAVW